MKNNPNIELKLSADGSHTLYVPALDEHYHSVNGARNESMHVFINAGLLRQSQTPLTILEIGFGTGLNAYLTALYCEDQPVFYHTVEKYPVSNHILEQLNYTAEDHKNSSIFSSMHSLPWNVAQNWHKNITLLKEQADITELSFSQRYNLIYFDAFAPDKQPELWSKSVFEKMYEAMLPGGILTTYCAKGVVRRTLQEVGFTVERLPGPKGKREMLRATK